MVIATLLQTEEQLKELFNDIRAVKYLVERMLLYAEGCELYGLEKEKFLEWFRYLFPQMFEVVMKLKAFYDEYAVK